MQRQVGEQHSQFTHSTRTLTHCGSLGMCSDRLVSSTAGSHTHSTRTLTHCGSLGMCSDRLVSSTAGSHTHSTRTLTHCSSLGMCSDRLVSSAASSHTHSTRTLDSPHVLRQVGEQHSQFTHCNRTLTHRGSLGMCSDRLVSNTAMVNPMSLAGLWKRSVNSVKSTLPSWLESTHIIMYSISSLKTPQGQLYFHAAVFPPGGEATPSTRPNHSKMLSCHVKHMHIIMWHKSTEEHKHFLVFSSHF